MHGSQVRYLIEWSRDIYVITKTSKYIDIGTRQFEKRSHIPNPSNEIE